MAVVVTQNSHAVLRLPSTVLLQVELTAALLHKHRALRPIVAGGVLWSWAAGVPARDIDLWIPRGVRAHWQTRKYAVVGPGRSSSLEGVKGNLVLRTYAADTPVDVVLHRYADPIEVFDFQHLMLSWRAPKKRTCHTCTTIAMSLFARGELRRGLQAPKPRDPHEYLKRISQNPLWGNAAAVPAMHALLRFLDAPQTQLPEARLVKRKHR